MLFVTKTHLLTGLLWRPAVAALRIAAALNVVEHVPFRIASSDFYEGNSTIVNGRTADLFVAGSGVDLTGNAETQGLLVAAQNEHYQSLRIIYTMVEVPYRLVASRRAGVEELADLRGKRIGAFSQTSSAYFVREIMATAGVNESEYTLVTGGTCNARPCSDFSLPSMLASGEIDAVGMWEPTLEFAIQALGPDAVVFQDGDAYREIYNLYTTAERLDDRLKRPEITEYVAALIKAGKLFSDSPEEVIPRAAEIMDMDEAVLEEVWPHHQWIGGLADDMLDVLIREDAWLAGMNERAPLSREQLAGLIDSSVFEEARMKVKMG
jgi:ABC-type nitrate/sulfonate/bicarbonate transport system substrate-binding protein